MTITNFGADLDSISPKARKMLEGIATVAGIPELRTRSGYRDPARNKKAGGANKGQHIHGNAIDLDISSYSDEQKKQILDAAIANGARGIGIYPSGNNLHIDVRDEAAMWGWNPAGAYAAAEVDTAPEWAKERLRTLTGGVERAPLADVPAPDQAPPAGRKLPSWWTDVEQHSATAGVDPDTLYRIGGAESMFRNVDNQSGKNGGSASHLMKICVPAEMR
jgi:hypothetical protein